MGYGPPRNIGAEKSQCPVAVIQATDIQGLYRDSAPLTHFVNSGSDV
jgi:hypothetical protein